MDNKECTRLLDGKKCIRTDRYAKPTFADGYGEPYLCTTPGNNFCSRLWVFECKMSKDPVQQLACSGNPNSPEVVMMLTGFFVVNSNGRGRPESADKV